MHETSLNLLLRLQNPADSRAWNRLTDLYAPLLRLWLRKYDVQATDADDLLQEVLLAIAKDMKKFEHGGRTGAFRAWLRAILANRLRHFWRARERRALSGGSDIERRLEVLEDPASEASRIWDRQHDEYVCRQLLKLVEPQFAPTTWSAFYRVAIEGLDPEVVASDLGISLNATFIAKSRVLSRLREESEGLV